MSSTRPQIHAPFAFVFADDTVSPVPRRRGGLRDGLREGLPDVDVFVDGVLAGDDVFAGDVFAADPDRIGTAKPTPVGLGSFILPGETGL